MVKHAILLTDKEWCEATFGKVRVYHFIGPKKRGIHALSKGSVCVVVTKGYFKWAKDLIDSKKRIDLIIECKEDPFDTWRDKIESQILSYQGILSLTIS